MMMMMMMMMMHYFTTKFQQICKGVCIHTTPRTAAFQFIQMFSHAHLGLVVWRSG